MGDLRQAVKGILATFAVSLFNIYTNYIYELQRKADNIKSPRTSAEDRKELR